MFTNTFTPHIGGVAHSVTWLAEGLRAAGHRVLIIAPEFAGAPADGRASHAISVLDRACSEAPAGTDRTILSQALAVHLR
ncbi:hypothetical protein [Mesorhizobium tianshanense]|uniref:hypothetical protein n=1 Tax=Mesorhizobium tianshanense TaxID=39844 RepID=UPI0012DEC2DE|nr:hypothetical protein [Mesorhizobium tianshanense]